MNKIHCSRKSIKPIKNTKCKEFVYALIDSELEHQKHRRETLDNKSNYLITLSIAILTFISVYFEFPTVDQLLNCKSIYLVFSFYTLCLGVLLNVISLILILWIITPDKYKVINVQKLVELNVDDFEVLLPVIIEKKAEALKTNEAINDRRFLLLKISIFSMIFGFLIICGSSIIMKINF